MRTLAVCSGLINQKTKYQVRSLSGLEAVIIHIVPMVCSLKCQSQIVTMMVFTFGVLVHLFVLCLAKNSTEDNKVDHYIIACHTTDFECFKRQYRALRNLILMGNPQLGVEYQPYIFEYGASGTCIKLTGVEDSEMIAMSIDSKSKEYSLVLKMPVRIQQIYQNSSIKCATPDKEFVNISKYEGPLKKFTGNATVQVTYPYSFREKKGLMFMQLDEENLDVLLDIPDLSHYDKESALEAKLYEWSEWAYDAVYHINLASQSIAPFTSNLNFLLERIPLDKFILLYPEEEYTELMILFGRTVDE